MDDIDTRAENNRVPSLLCKVCPSRMRFQLPAKAFAMNSDIVAGGIRVSIVRRVRREVMGRADWAGQPLGRGRIG